MSTTKIKARPTVYTRSRLGCPVPLIPAEAAARPPAGLSPRVAEVVQALIEARVFAYGGPVTLDDVVPYDSWIGGRADAGRTLRALREACEAGLAWCEDSDWRATLTAYRLRDKIEAWFYG